MVPVKSILSGCPLERNGTCRRGADPVAYAVRVALVVYLSPVLLLVAAIGVTGMAAGQVVRLAGKLVGFARGRDSSAGARARAALTARPPVIGVRPIMAVRRTRSRVTR
jgi:hypothetical protein